MAAGFFLTVAVALVLVAGVRAFGATYGPADWLVAALGNPGARGVLLLHRALATLTFLVLLAQVISGWRRHRLHRRLARLLVPLWLLSYGSGLVIFQ
jgi:uncharacterized membrane protein YozB (DUF420 family)